MTATFLGKPPAFIEEWLIGKDEPSTESTTVKFLHKANIYVENGTEDFTVTLDGTTIYPEE